MADKPSKQKQSKSSKKGKGAKPEIHDGIEAVSVANHPRTAFYVRRAKGWGGLGGFVIAALLSLKASVPVAQTLERALLGGIVGFLVCWALALVVCRQMVIAEMRAIRDQLREPAEQVPDAAAQGGRRGRDPGARAAAAGRSSSRAGAGAGRR